MTSIHNLRIGKRLEIAQENEKWEDKEGSPEYKGNNSINSNCALRVLAGLRSGYESGVRIEDDDLEVCGCCDELPQECTRYVPYNRQEPEQIHQLDYIQELIDGNLDGNDDGRMLTLTDVRGDILVSGKKASYDSIEDRISNGADALGFIGLRRTLRYHNTGKIEEYRVDSGE